jgi:hypothetical protein
MAATRSGEVAGQQAEQAEQTRLALGAMVVPLFFVTLFALCIIGVYHKPHPNNIKLGVAGPPAQTAALRAGLQKAGGDAFDVRTSTTLAAATRAVRDRDLNAAVVPNVNPRGPATVIVAGGGGRLVAKASEDFVRAVLATRGQPVVARDVRPLVAGDALGLGIFMFMIVCTIGGYFAATILGTIAPALAPRRRYPIILAMAVLMPLIVYLIGGLGFGTYEGSFGTIVAFVAVGALYTLVVGLVTRLLQVLLGRPALFVALILFIFLNIPSLGATYTSEMLAPFWRFFSHVWIGAQTVEVERSLLYFGGLDAATHLLWVLVWAVVALTLLAAAVAWKLGRQDRVPSKGRDPWRASTTTS